MWRVGVLAHPPHVLGFSEDFGLRGDGHGGTLGRFRQTCGLDFPFLHRTGDYVVEFGTRGLGAIVFRKHALRIAGASLLRQFGYTGGKGRSFDRRDPEGIQFIA